MSQVCPFSLTLAALPAELQEALLPYLSSSSICRLSKVQLRASNTLQTCRRFRSVVFNNPHRLRREKTTRVELQLHGAPLCVLLPENVEAIIEINLSRYILATLRRIFSFRNSQSFRKIRGKKMSRRISCEDPVEAFFFHLPHITRRFAFSRIRLENNLTSMVFFFRLL